VLGGLLHIAFHATIKITLFLVAGSFIANKGYHNVDELRGIGKAMPITLWSFTLASLALVGIPPFSGFVSKWYLAEGALASGLTAMDWLAPVVLLISALLTAGYLLPITISGFFPGKGAAALPRKEGSASLWMPVAILGLATLILGIAATPLADAFAQLAASLFV